MSFPIPYLPQAVFSVQGGPQPNVPRALIAPSRYIQGDRILDHLGRYLSIVPSKRAAILFSVGAQQRFGERVSKSLNSVQVDSTWVTFQGECSYEEVHRVEEILRAEPTPVDSVIALGGGKCIDTGRFVAYRLGVPVVVCPTLASNDAPCAALSVMYRPDGVHKGVEFFPHSPALVAIDSGIVAKAPVRYLVAGMGDAMATWYEARTCLQNSQARTVLGARPTLAASAIGELCANTLFEHGLSAIEAVKRSEVDDALERIVEANTLLSGIGFESGGLAGAHSIAQSLTVVPKVHHSYLHGEMVAIGLLTQLHLEEREDEGKKVAEFFAKVGLPIHLGQISLSPKNEAEVNDVMEAAMTLPILRNEPFEVTKISLLTAASKAHEMGLEIEQTIGNAAYNALHHK
ncbi:MAG: glycerol dehydrogenase [Nitrospirota bacterium]|nr:MAG: glycerol dehydrogenase [Nitrospirota bacterium]